MALDLTNIVGNLERLGFYDFVLPWLLFFAVILGVLNSSSVLGSDKKVNSIVAAVVAFFIVNFTPVGGISAYYSTIFGVGGMIAGVLVVLVILGGVLGFKPSDFLALSQEGAGKKPEKSPAAYAVVGILLVVFAYVAYAWAVGSTISGLTLGGDTWTLIFILAFVLLVIWFATSGKQPEKPTG